MVLPNLQLSQLRAGISDSAHILVGDVMAVEKPESHQVGPEVPKYRPEAGITVEKMLRVRVEERESESPSLPAQGCSRFDAAYQRTILQGRFQPHQHKMTLILILAWIGLAARLVQANRTQQQQSSPLGPLAEREA